MPPKPGKHGKHSCRQWFSPPPRGSLSAQKVKKLHFLVFSAFSIIFMKSEEMCGNDKKLPTFGVWAENDPPEPLKKHCPSKVFGRAGRRCAHFMKIGEIPGKSPKICTFSSKTAIFTHFQHFHIFAILRFRSISVPPTPPEINTFLFILGGGRNPQNVKKPLLPLISIGSLTHWLLIRPGLIGGPPGDHFHSFMLFPKSRVFAISQLSVEFLENPIFSWNFMIFP